jgi:hypothetical protein
MDVCEIANLIYEPLGNGKQGKKKAREKEKRVLLPLLFLETNDECNQSFF